VSANSNDVKRDAPPFTAVERTLSRPAVYWSIAGILLVAAIVSRFLFLDAKAFHHDESLHAYYSHRVAGGSPHEYSALLHGPFLYYFTGAVMWIMGSTDFVARSAAALFGVGLVATPLLMRRFWGSTATLALMALFLTSPMTLYFGRFLREDAFVSVWVVGTVFGGFLFWRERKAWALYLSVAMLAFHFVNKENSYLHTLLWGLGILAITLFARRFEGASSDGGSLAPASTAPPLAPSDKRYLALNAASIFATIYILFYSSFFRHSKGAWHGVVDGIYRESLLYWWDQNKKRRIDGPFDFHLPLIANYEFLVVPLGLLAWGRVVSVGRAKAPNTFNGRTFSGVCLALLAACFLLPRVAFLPEACAYATVCLDTISKPLGDAAHAFAKPLHIAHSRHLLQILAYIAFGAAAFFSALALRRRLDAFVWFWLTGALGVYSYVGEKVPWLTAYILLPLFILVALELARLFTRSSLPSDSMLFADPARADAIAQEEARFSRRWWIPATAWIVLALPFTLWKAGRASFVRPDGTDERLVFTQTTPTVKTVRDRWRAARKANAGKPFKVGMIGDATWPFAWYAEEFSAGDFAKPTPESAAGLDVILIDYGELERAKKDFPAFDAYALPLRHWWVPGPDPGLADIVRYFFKGEPYKRTPQSAENDTGTGDTKILYLEKRASPFFAGVPRPDFLQLLHEASAP
jgi:uncharacterized protein (TIGR03663 family)